MNKSYRVIWNYALQCYVVTSELARGKVKSSCSGKPANKSILAGGALGSALLLAGSPMALAANGATVNDPAQPVELNKQTLQATGDKYYGLLVQNGAKATATDVTVLNAGTSGYGVFSTAGSASAEMTRGSVTTSGAGGYGVVASLTGAVKTSGTKVETSGQTAHGAYASSGGIINSTDTDYVTHGDGAYGVYSRATGSLIDLSGGSITTDGSKAYGLYAGSGGQLNASGVQVITSGQNAHGAYITGEDSQLRVDGSTIETRGQGANGLNADGKSTLDATNTAIKITGSGSGTSASGAGTVLNLSDSQIEMGHGAGNAVLNILNSTTNLKNVEILTDSSYSALASAFGGTLNSDDISVKARSGGYGIEVQDGSTFSGKNITIEKSGTDAEGFNAAINVLNLYYPDAHNTLSLNDSAINVSGESATGIVSKRQATLADIKLANTAITATEGTAVNVLTGTDMHIDADNSLLSGSTLLKTGYSTTEGATAGSVVLNGSNHSLFEGNVDIDRSQTTDSQINLSGSSAWTGV
ncbi:ESPR domain-containing protein, partial [uncultured Pantoea sp.]|uniref:ESPR domain-containing protein n=1 Tax=uncultured Pantoea sp. TaxID=218084 RepID=UPI0025855316